MNIQTQRPTESKKITNLGASKRDTPSKPSIEEWLKRVSECSTQQIAGIIDTGKVLLEAKASLKGQWSDFKKSNTLPFASRKCEMLMKISKNQALSDPQFFRQLPESWSALHALTAIPEDKLVEFLNDGSIHPRLSIKAAKELDPKYKAKPTRPLSAASLSRIRERIEESAHHWRNKPNDESQELLESLAELDEQIKSTQQTLEMNSDDTEG